MTPFLQFKPIYQERVWGGRGLESYLDRKIPAGAPIGESWEIVDRPDAQSVVASGPWAGMTLRQTLEKHPVEVMGPDWRIDRPFPILVKWLDCRDRLSVQVHPPAEIARKLKGEPKTENWYFGKSDAGAAVYAGLQAGVTPEELARAIDAGTVDKCLDRLAVANGDSLLIRSGTMHAIDAGNIILEIQQNSDTTYRVYDWGRLGLDGKPRTLHVRESLECVRANTAGSPGLIKSPSHARILAKCPEFTIRCERLAPGGRLSFAAKDQSRILSMVTGQMECAADSGPALRLGDNVLLPYAENFAFVAKNAAVVLVTEDYAGP